MNGELRSVTGLTTLRNLQGRLHLPLRLHGRLTDPWLHDGVAGVFVQVHVSGEHDDWRSRLRSATDRSVRSLLQDIQRRFRDPFFCRNCGTGFAVRRTDVQGSGYKEPVLVTILCRRLVHVPPATL